MFVFGVAAVDTPATSSLLRAGPIAAVPADQTTKDAAIDRNTIARKFEFRHVFFVAIRRVDTALVFARLASFQVPDDLAAKRIGLNCAALRIFRPLQHTAIARPASDNTNVTDIAVIVRTLSTTVFG